MTIMEEGTELVKACNRGRRSSDVQSSCCPAWVKFLENNYPELSDHLSWAAKSPQQIGGAIFKTYGAQLEGKEGKDIYSVSVMPCTCKEFESERPEMKDSGFRDVDVAITTRDLAWLIKDMGIDWDELEDQEFDQPLGLYTGAGTIFGVTGGVMEAAIRTGYELVTGQPIPVLSNSCSWNRGIPYLCDKSRRSGSEGWSCNRTEKCDPGSGGSKKRNPGSSFYRSDDLSGGMRQRRRAAEAAYGYGQRSGLCGKTGGNLCP